MFPLRRVDRLVLAEVIGPFVFSVLMFTSVFFAGSEFLRIAEFIGRGVPIDMVARLFILTLPYIIALTFPMAMLLATLLGFGRLSNDSEVVALTASGTSFERIVAPVALFSFLVSLIGLWFADSVVPAADREREAIIKRVREQGAVGSTAPGFTIPILKSDMLTVVRVQGGLDIASGTLRNVSIERWKNSRVTDVIYADRAKWTVGTNNWQLYDFDMATLDPGTSDTRAVLSGTSGQTLEGLGVPKDLESLQGEPKELSIVRLRERIRTLGDSPAALSERRAAETEIARRIALPLATFVFALVGAPLGVRPQRGGKGVGFGLAIVIIFAYWVSFQFLTYLGQSGALPAWLALNIPNFLGIAAALYLIRQVMR